MKTSLIRKHGWLIVLCFCLPACVPWSYFYPSLAPEVERSWSITASVEPLQGEGSASLDVSWQKGDKIKVSFRAKTDGDVGSIAQAMGGGGHKKASGCTLDMSMEEACAKVKSAVAEALK